VSVRLGEQFAADCAQWYAKGPRARNAGDARFQVFKALVRRHGGQSVVRHQPAITKALTRIELQYARGEARDILLRAIQEAENENAVA
jgi:hypothetical protein